jgi:hypothetical protein
MVGTIGVIPWSGNPGPVRSFGSAFFKGQNQAVGRFSLFGYYP